jgi:hypothetical protein
MTSRRSLRLPALAGACLALALAAAPARAQEVKGTVKSVDIPGRKIVLKLGPHKDVTVRAVPDAEGKDLDLKQLKKGDAVTVTNAVIASKIDVLPPTPHRTIFQEFWHNFTHNLFKPLLLFFYMGFLVPFLRVKFEFPYVIYQGLTIYLLIAIGWHGGEELAGLDPSILGSVFGFMLVGFVTNFFIGIVAYQLLKAMTNLRRIDKATVAGYYGSDSAGTFVTTLGVLATVKINYDAYMPVMLAVMEVPGCLVALYLVSKLRHQGMDPLGNMPDEPGYDPNAIAPLMEGGEGGHNGHGQSRKEAVEAEKEMSLEKMEHGNGNGNGTARSKSFLSPKLLHEVFLNPGLYLLFGGIVVGFISGLQGKEVTRADDNFFVDLFQGVLCLFLLEMGMTASRKLMDLRTAGVGYVAFGLLAPNLFAITGILVAHAYSSLTGTPFELGTYVLFAVLCGAASYIAVPAVQRLAIPEASPTLPLAASLGLTFSYNVTVGIPVYIEIAKAVTKYWH